MNALQIVTETAARRLALSTAQIHELGVGYDPTGEEIAVRREEFAATARYLSSAGCRKAARATTPAKVRRLAKAVRPHCSATAERLWDLAAGVS